MTVASYYALASGEHVLFLYDLASILLVDSPGLQVAREMPEIEDAGTGSICSSEGCGLGPSREDNDCSPFYKNGETHRLLLK